MDSECDLFSLEKPGAETWFSRRELAGSLCDIETGNAPKSTVDDDDVELMWFGVKKMSEYVSISNACSESRRWLMAT